MQTLDPLFGLAMLANMFIVIGASAGVLAAAWDIAGLIGEWLWRIDS